MPDYDEVHATADMFLEFLINRGGRGSFYQFSDLTHLDNSKIHSAITYLISEKRIIEYPVGNRDYDLLPEGRKLIKSGGYKQLLSEEAENDQIDKELKSLSLEKARYEVKNAKRIYKTYWWTFVIAILGLILSIFNLLIKQK